MTTVDRGHPSALPVHEAVEHPPGDLLASWGRRVLAVVLDHALIAAVTFLVVPVQPVSPLTLPGLPPTVPDVPLGSAGAVVVGREMWWVAGLVAAMMLAQAYLGTTPGKLVLGIAVVRLDDARPAGLARTALRSVVHVLDGLVLMIGFLRPLWHPRRQTWADSAVGTVVLRTDAPLPFLPRWGRASAAAPPPWERPAPAPWRRAAWWTVAVACGPALVLTYGGSSVTSEGGTYETCSPLEESPLHEVTVDATPPHGTVTRLGITRTHAMGSSGVSVHWSVPDDVPDGTWSYPLELRVAFTSADGTTTRTAGATLESYGDLWPDDAHSSIGPWTVDGDRLVLPYEYVDYLGDGWTWEAWVTTSAGEVLGRCSYTYRAPEP